MSYLIQNVFQYFTGLREVLKIAVETQ